MNLCQYSDYFCNFVKNLGANDFNRGYACGIGIVFAIFILLLIIRCIVKIIFRRRRCSEIIVPSSDGDVSISVSAVEDTVRTELNNFPSVKVNKIRLYRIKKKYQLNLVCEYDGRDGGLPDITRKIKKAVSDMANEFFGVSTIRKINLKFDRLSRDKSLIITAENPSDAQVITPAHADSEKENDSANDIF